MILSDTAIKNRTTVGVFVVLILAVGVMAYLTLPRESAPDVPVPNILVTTVYEGVAPQDVETAVTMKIEKKLQGLKGVKEVTSASFEGQSVVMVEFLPDQEVDECLRRVKDKVDQARGDLPQEIEEPIVSEINIAEMPIMFINISGPISTVTLKLIADELEDRIEAVPGVLDCEVLGAPEREIRLEMHPDRLAQFGLTIPEILQLVPSENLNVSAGGLETPGTKFNVRVPAEFVTPDQIDHLIIAQRDGKPIYLSDVASVSDSFKDRLTLSRLDANNSITLSVKKRIGENILTIADTIRYILAEADKQVPEAVDFAVTMDRSDDTRRMVADLENNMFAAFVLVMVVVLLFMGWRSSLVVALAIPLSMLMSFAVIQLMGFTLNMIVLFSLVLAVGMLVDNAIVIVENIHRHMELGLDRLRAAMKGTAEVAWPVITSTLTTVAAFLPMAFWPGIMGDFMKYLPITVIIVLLSSLVVAMVISPVVATLSLRVVPHAENRRENLFLRGYRRVLRLAIEHRGTTLLLSLLLMVALITLYGKKGAGVEFFPDVDPKRAVLNVRTPQGTNIYKTDAITRLCEQRIAGYSREIQHVIAGVGNAGGFNLGLSNIGPHLANVTILFPDFENRKRPSADAVKEMRRDLEDIVGGELELAKERAGPPTGAPITVRLLGEDFALLKKLSEQAADLIRHTPNMVNLRSDLEDSRPEIVFRPDRRRAMLLGVNTQIVGNFLKTSIFGTKVSTYRQFNDEYDITIRLPLEQRTEIDDLLRLRVPNQTGQSVPLSSLGDFEYRPGFGTIYRINQKRAVTLTADVEGRLAPAVLADVQEELKKLELPANYEIQYAGEEEESQNAKAFLGRAGVIALLLIVLVLVAQFNTLSVPLVIMTTVLLSTMGVMIGLLIHNMPFGVIMTGIGVISLAGVVVNNAIVLLDYIRRLQREGKDVVEAAIEAGITRLRPVMLTAITTIAGLIPTAAGFSFDIHTWSWATKSESSQWWASMAIAVIYGLGFATLLTLVVVPSLYVLFYRLAARLGLGGLKKIDAEPDDHEIVELESDL
ncbi:MAG TPA: efflux RND transporter permease subunit [Phycisphaerae bacterium]|nr:efflux RND transporter permease subunit [Phycisphaerae bacterium]